MKIIQISDLEKEKRNSIPKKAGVYVFWWSGAKPDLLNGIRKIKLKGPGGIWVTVELQDWWPQELEYPCLYIGKSTNLKNRYSQQLLLNRQGRLHTIDKDNKKAKLVTTSCQVRYGIEHVFRDDNPIDIMLDNLSFSFIDWFPSENSIAERFYLEDRLIGQWRPWFNVDSER